MDCKKRGEHAVVVGASLAGMSQAAVLSRYFEKVTILESDTIDLTQAASRKGVPQDRQLHGLLNRGLVNLEKFLPGLHQDLLKVARLRSNTAAIFAGT